MQDSSTASFLARNSPANLPPDHRSEVAYTPSYNHLDSIFQAIRQQVIMQSCDLAAAELAINWQGNKHVAASTMGWSSKMENRTCVINSPRRIFATGKSLFLFFSFLSYTRCLCCSVQKGAGVTGFRIGKVAEFVDSKSKESLFVGTWTCSSIPWTNQLRFCNLP